MDDILRVFKGLSTLYDVENLNINANLNINRSGVRNESANTDWSLAKDCLQLNDIVRSRKANKTCCQYENMHEDSQWCCSWLGERKCSCSCTDIWNLWSKKNSFLMSWESELWISYRRLGADECWWWEAIITWYFIDRDGKAIMLDFWVWKHFGQVAIPTFKWQVSFL